MSQPPLPSSMCAMEIREGGLVASSVPLPVVKDGEVLVRVAYVGVNRADLLQVEGKYHAPVGASPLPGLEVSGWLAGSGQQVCALLSGGGYAEYVAVPAAQVLALPAGVSLKEAASLPEALATSVMALVNEAQLQVGERVLIHGGASGVGVMMTQVAKYLGAEVFATVGSEEKMAMLQARGITPIDHRASPFAAQVMAANKDGVDIIIDTLGGPMVETHLRLLRPRGRLVTLAMLEGSEVPTFKMTRLLMNHLRWSGATLRSRSAAEKAAIITFVAEKLWPGLADVSIMPVIDSVFALLEAKKAHERMQERLHMGKILLEVTAN
ncbi:MAG: zinc-binding dehydrogenase [Rickettsiales bacterium]